MGIRYRDFRVWHTDRQLVNAAIAGLLPSQRYVFLTDALLGHLDDEQVEAVVLHELGHVRRRHLPLRMMLLGLPLWMAASVQATQPELAARFSSWAAQISAGQSLLPCLALCGATVLYAVLALGCYSRVLEHDADLCVCRHGRGPAFVAALRRLSQLCGSKQERWTWLHPSTGQRIHLLQLAMVDAQVARRFHRQVDRFNGLLVAGFLLMPLLCRAVSYVQ
jgi:STE24 endopeptidase